jgi:predicted DNA-binding transcriptional regulator YafY
MPLPVYYTMAKVDHLLLIINLLTHRDGVSLDRIVRECKISSRTAYRYMRTLRDTGMPLHFSKATATYALKKPADQALGSIPLNEAILVVIALALLSSHVSPEYQLPIQHLISKVLSQTNIISDNLNEALKAQVPNGGALPDITELLNTILLMVAVETRRPVVVKYQHSDGEMFSLTLNRPALSLEGDWYLLDADGPEGTRLQLSMVSHVALHVAAHRPTPGKVRS